MKAEQIPAVAFRCWPILLASLAVVSFANAGEVRLQWDRNSETDLAGYKVYYGTASGRYGIPIAAGLQTNYTVSNLAAGTYYFAVTAINGSGVESGFSNEVSAIVSDPGGTNGGVNTGPTPDNTPPTITGVEAPYVSTDSAVISWGTSSDADSQIEFGNTTSYGSVTSLDSNRTTRHALVLTGLKASTLYHFRVKSRGATGLLAVSKDYTLTTSALTATLTTLYYPRTTTSTAGTNPASSGGIEYTGLAVANFDSAEAALIFTAFDKNGTPVAGTGIRNPAVRTLLPGEQIPVIDTQLFGDSLQSSGYAGWIRIESSMKKVAAFFLVFDASLSVLDGTNVSTAALPDFVLSEIEGQGYTQLSIANPNADPVDIRLDLMKADGAVRASMSGTVNPHGVLTGDLRRNFFSNVVPNVSDYVRGSANRGVLPFERLGKISQYTECLNGLDTAAGSTTLYAPQFAFGGSWGSSLSIVNLDGIPGMVTMKYYANDAKQIGVSRTQTIAPYGKISINAPDYFAAATGGRLLEGYVEVVSNGARLAGSVVFGDTGRKQFSAALPLISSPRNAALFSHVASDETYFTGLAILNPGSADATVTLDLYSADGALDASVTQIIPAHQRKSKLLTEYFPVLVGQARISGYFKVTASQPVACFALVGTNDLSVLAAVPPQEMPQ